MDDFTKRQSKKPKLHTNTHAVRVRLTQKGRKKRNFRTESTYRELKSKIDIQRYTNETQRYTNDTLICSNAVQTKSNYVLMNSYGNLKTRNTRCTSTNNNTNSQFHSELDPLYSIKPLRRSIARNWPNYLTISLLLIYLLECYSLNSFSQIVLLLYTVIAECLVNLFHVVMQFNDFFDCLANECLLEKAEDLSTCLYVSNITNRGDLRSRYSKFIASKGRLHQTRTAIPRDREPSRIPVNKLTRIMNKSRIIRREVRKYIAKHVPRSSKIHCYVNKCNFLHEKCGK